MMLSIITTCLISPDAGVLTRPLFKDNFILVTSFSKTMRLRNAKQIQFITSI